MAGPAIPRLLGVAGLAIQTKRGYRYRCDVIPVTPFPECPAPAAQPRWPAVMRSLAACGALAGEPAWNGGCGSYSIMSWMASA